MSQGILTSSHLSQILFPVEDHLVPFTKSRFGKSRSCILNFDWACVSKRLHSSQALHETLQVINRTMKWTNLPTFFTQYKSLQEIQDQNDDCDKHSSYDKIHLKGPRKTYSTNWSFKFLFIASGNLPTLLKKVPFYEILCRCNLQRPCWIYEGYPLT